MRPLTLLFSLLLPALASQANGQSRPDGDYYAASVPNAANLSTITREFVTYATLTSVSTVVRNDIPGKVLAIEPIDHGSGSVLVLARNSQVAPATTLVYELLSPFLAGPFVPWNPPFVRYAPPLGVQVVDLKVDGFAGGFLTLVGNGFNISLQRHAPNGAVTGTFVNFTGASSAYLGVDGSNGDIFVVDGNGVMFQFNSSLGLLAAGVTSPPLIAAADVAIDGRVGHADRVVVAGTDAAGGPGLFRFFANRTLASAIYWSPADSVSVDFEGNVTSQAYVGGGTVLHLMSPGNGAPLRVYLNATPPYAAMSWFGRSAFGVFSSSANSLLGITPTPALVGNTTMDYGFTQATTLVSLAYLISFSYCFPCSNLGPFADLFVDLNNPTTQAITIPIPTGNTFSYPLVITPSLNGLQFFVQLLGADSNMNFVASNAISQTIGLRPIE
ncbi:MAG TPA: hypothetical protein VFZ65_00830 [Planctomycetota bacterium]|nr:hypothetical protein [Planctomycetota bacterium]